jgi:NhaP-type Na+/H+ and K+/H+ antiporter
MNCDFNLAWIFVIHWIVFLSFFQLFLYSFNNFPVSVYLCTIPFEFSLSNWAFLSQIELRGAELSK